MATVKENITNALTWFYDRLKDKYFDPFNERITANGAGIEANASDIQKNADDIQKNADDIQKNADDISELNTNMSDLIVVEPVDADNVTVSAASNTYSSLTTGTIDASKSGYSIIGIAGFYMANASDGGTNVSNCYFARCYLNDSGKIAYGVGNHCAGTAIIRVRIFVLYKKVL